NPVLAAEETLRLQDGTPIQPIGNYRYGARCGFGDWNNDGWPDFLLSGYEGYVQLHLGLPFVGVSEERGSAPDAPRPTLGPKSLLAGADEVFDALGRRISSRQSVRHGIYFVRTGNGQGRLVVVR
ncbi:MAG: hypothetical protein ABIK44_05010, partial [candidate division WOR-3 bacterium]